MHIHHIANKTLLKNDIFLDLILKFIRTKVMYIIDKCDTLKIIVKLKLPLKNLQRGRFISA
jgi:hypothetical protein